MLMDQAMNIMEKLVQELKDTEPSKRDHLIKSMVTIFELSTEIMKESPKFREGFALVHSEFLKYPESKATIEEAIKAFDRQG